MTLGTLATQAEAIQTAYNSSQQELEALRDATLEVCQSVEEGDGQVESSVASRLHALGGHVSRRMWGALRLGIQKTLGVVQSHYQVNLTAIATGYIITDGLVDDAAEAEVNRLDALAAPAADILANHFMEILFPDAPPAGPPRALRVVGHSGP
jgi:hypothetical protein